MASNSESNYDLVEKPDDEFFCPVTFELLKDPVQTSYCCGNQVEINSISFNEDTREFSVSLTMTSIDEDGYSSTDNPVTTTISFSGTLSWENTVAAV